MKGNGDFSIGSDVWPGTSKLIEEMGELQQVLGKLIGSHGDPAHWDGSDLRKRLVEEIADLLVATAFFRVHSMRPDENEAIDERVKMKLALFQKWHEKP